MIPLGTSWATPPRLRGLELALSINTALAYTRDHPYALGLHTKGDRTVNTHLSRPVSRFTPELLASEDKHGAKPPQLGAATAAPSTEI